MTHTSTKQPKALPTPEAVTEQAQVFASAWALYGSGSILEPENSAEVAAEAKAELAQMVRHLHARIAELEAVQAQRVPMTDEQILEAFRAAKKITTDHAGWVREQRIEHGRAIERAHGITQEKQG